LYLALIRSLGGAICTRFVRYDARRHMPTHVLNAFVTGCCFSLLVLYALGSVGAFSRPFLIVTLLLSIVFLRTPMRIFHSEVASWLATKLARRDPADRLFLACCVVSSLALAVVQ